MCEADIEAWRGIYYPVTIKTTDMVMICRHPVKPFETAAELEFLNLTTCAKNLKIAIYSSETDAGKTLADHFIYLISAGMRIDVAKFFQDDLTLLGHPQV